MKLNNKTKYCLLFFFSFVFLTITQLLFFGNRLDYYWNYNNSLQISNGLLPYKDINIITTPLFHFIVSIFLTIFGKSIVIYAAALSILDIVYIYACTKITHILIHKKNDNIDVLTYCIYTFFLYHSYFEYNLLSCLFLLFIILLEIKNKNAFLIGILAGLSLLSKQSVGIFAIIFVIIKPFIFGENKKESLYRTFGAIIPIALFVFYLLCTNIFNDFISYCITGLKEFNNSFSVFEFIKISDNFIYLLMTLILYFVSFSILICYIIKWIKKKISKINKIIIYYSLVCFVCIYPIRDIHHIFPGFLVILPFVIKFIYNKTKNIININYMIILKRCFCVFVISFPIIATNMYINIWINEEGNERIVLKDDYNSINGIVVENTFKESMDRIIKYEKQLLSENKKVLVLNENSVIYHLSQNLYYKDYDLFMRGNFGENGENRLINEIKNSENTYYIIDLYDYGVRDTKYNQIPIKIVEYVINNYEEVGTIDRYTVYTK